MEAELIIHARRAGKRGMPAHFRHDIEIVEIDQGHCRESVKASKTNGAANGLFIAKSEKDQGGWVGAESGDQVATNVVRERLAVAHGQVE